MKNILYLFLIIPFFSQAQVGVETNSPTETLHVQGTARLNELPLDGTTNVIATQPSNGEASLNSNGTLNKNQAFTASKTIVMDDNGVLGAFQGKPKIGEEIKTVTYVTKNVEIQSQTDGGTQNTSVITLGNISVRFDGEKPTGGRQSLSFRLNHEKDNVIVNQIKIGSGGGSSGRFIDGGQNRYFSAAKDDWKEITDQKPEVRNGDYVQYNIALLNTREVYRLTVSVNPTESNLGIVGQVSLFLEKLSNEEGN